jgi:iron complex outermembrane receptor protein
VFPLVTVLIGSAFTLSVSAGIADAAQARSATIRVEVRDAGGPIAGARVTPKGGQPSTTDAAGVAVLAVPPGRVDVVATKDGYEMANDRVEVAAGQNANVRLVLTPKPAGQDDPIVAGSTRIARRMDEQPIPVDVITRSTIEDTLAIAPGNVVTLLDRMQSLRAQTTSPELGLTMLRIRGLRGHYARLFSDGVPLDFDRSGGLPLMQMSPMDIAQVEVLTEGASAIFGVNALSGAVNLLSRRPASVPTREFLFSQSASGGTDGALWFSTPPTRNWSTATLFGGHWQNERDVDDDGWSDFTGQARGEARTRVYYDDRRGKSASGTAGVTFEKREGGSAFAHQTLESKEADGALFGQMPLGKYTLAGAATMFVQSRTRDFADRREHERRQSATIEITLSRPSPRNTWLVGIASEWFANRTPTVPLPSAYVYTGPSIFLHDELPVASWLTASGSVRLDYHLDDGAVLSPRASALVHDGPWAARISAGRSYSKPKALTEETEAAGFVHLTIDGPLERESADSVSAGLTHTTRASIASITVFRTQVNHPALVDRSTYTLRTQAEPIESQGVEILGTARRALLSVTGTYTYARTREARLRPGFGGQADGSDLALTPRHSASVIAAVSGARGRIGLEVFFTGEQRLDRNPYRSTSEAYTVINLLGEYRIGRARLFVNGQNLTNVRQTNWDPIARLAPDVDGRWTVDAWAPLAGRVINFGIRASF